MSVWRKIIYTLLIFVGFFASIEFALRVTKGPLAPSILVYSSIGDLQEWFFVKNGYARPLYKVNARNFSVTSEKPRMAFLGGSTVHGGSPTVLLQQEFPHLIGKQLSIDVLNLARPSIDSHDILRIVEELQHFDFTHWVIYTGHNDFGNAYFFQRYKTWNAGVEAKTRSWLSSLHMYNLLKRTVQPVNSLQKTLGWENFHGDAVSFEQRELILKHLKENILRINWLGRKQGVKVTFVLPIASATKRPLGNCNKSVMNLCSHDIHRKALRIQSQNPQKARELFIESWEYDTIPLRIPFSAQQELKSFFEEKQLHYFDLPSHILTDPIMQLPDDNLFHDHVHLSKEGHQLVAQKLGSFLQ